MRAELVAPFSSTNEALRDLEQVSGKPKGKEKLEERFSVGGR